MRRNVGLRADRLRMERLVPRPASPSRFAFVRQDGPPAAALPMDTLLEVAKRLKIALEPAQLESFEIYYQRLVSERATAGLTSLKDRAGIERRHFGESLALLGALEALEPIRS